MKKSISKISLILALCMAVSMVLCACGGSSGSADLSTEIIGDWTLTSITDAEGNSQTLAEYCAAQGVDSGSMEAVYSFADGGVVTASIGGIGVEGTYSIDGNTVNMSFDSGDTALEYSNGTLNASDAASGMSSVFTK